MTEKFDIYCLSCTTKNQIVEHLAKDKLFLASLDNSIGSNINILYSPRKDMVQDIYETLLDKPEAKIIELNNTNQIIKYVYQVIHNMNRDKKYQKKYKIQKPIDGSELEYNDNKEELLNQLDIILKSMDKSKRLYTKKIVLLKWKLEGYTKEEIANETKVDILSIIYAIDTAKKYIIKKKNELDSL